MPVKNGGTTSLVVTFLDGPGLRYRLWRHAEPIPSFLTRAPGGRLYITNG